MRPVLVVAGEIFVLAFFLALGTLVPVGLPFALYVIFGQLLSTYLAHCPAHYVVGTLVGIRFRSARLGRTTLSRALPERLAGPTRLIPILTLSTEKGSMARVSKRRVATMYASGAIASASAALVIAAVATLAEPSAYAVLAWAVGIFYLGFDLVFSPKSGDLMRAKVALRS